MRRRNVLKDQEAVSPVIATILMVAITVVLAATLYMMLPQTDTDDQLTAMSGRQERIEDGWVVSIDGGDVLYSGGESFRLYNKTSGAAMEVNVVEDGAESPEGDYSAEVYQNGEHIRFNDNDNNGRVNNGDTILIYDPARVLQDDYEFRITGTNLEITL